MAATVTESIEGSQVKFWVQVEMTIILETSFIPTLPKIEKPAQNI